MSLPALAPRARIPDFFLVGHQKCGTTALHLMLKQVPQIYMPEAKEPRFFASDLRSRFGPRATKARPLTLDGYLGLFAAARADQRVGEASPQYLRSGVAASLIAELQPDARIIAILREPASFLRSFHLQMVASSVEPERDFRKAIELEQDRREGRRIPERCHTPATLLYSDHVRYVEQLQRFHAVFPSEHVLVLLYEEFRRDNETAMREVLRFLDVDDTSPIAVIETKPLKAVRSTHLHNLRVAVRAARRHSAAAGPVSRTVIALTPKPLRSGSFPALVRRAAYTSPRPPDQAFMLELRRRFKPEVEALSAYLDRDLVTFWGYDRIA